MRLQIDSRTRLPTLADRERRHATRKRWPPHESIEDDQEHRGRTCARERDTLCASLLNNVRRRKRQRIAGSIEHAGDDSSRGDSKAVTSTRRFDHTVEWPVISCGPQRQHAESCTGRNRLSLDFNLSRRKQRFRKQHPGPMETLAAVKDDALIADGRALLQPEEIAPHGRLKPGVARVDQFIFVVGRENQMNFTWRVIRGLRIERQRGNRDPSSMFPVFGSSGCAFTRTVRKEIATSSAANTSSCIDGVRPMRNDKLFSTYLRRPA
ncbi:MAG: hypothetical protein QOI24_4288 [Acidobacteriota bacterium]|nr:hypothetical protein [Acidobacteriota bacterium]